MITFVILAIINTNHNDELLKRTLIIEHNAIRNLADLQSYIRNPELDQAAQDYAKLLANKRSISHYNNGNGPGQRAGAAGYNGIVLENLSRGYETPSQIMRALYLSDLHQKAILSDSINIGIGLARSDTLYCVILYGKPLGAGIMR